MGEERQSRGDAAIAERGRLRDKGAGAYESKSEEQMAAQSAEWEEDFCSVACGNGQYGRCDARLGASATGM